MRIALQLFDEHTCVGDLATVRSPVGWPAPVSPSIIGLHRNSRWGRRTEAKTHGPTLRRLSFQTATGEQREVDLDRAEVVGANTLQVRVPDFAVAGPLHVDFEPGIAPMDDYQFEANFAGGASFISFLGQISNYSNRCLLPGESIRLEVSANNVEKLSVRWNFLRLDGSDTRLGGFQEFDGAADLPDIRVPHTREPLICRLSVLGDSRCPRGTQLSRTRIWLVEPLDAETDWRPEQGQVQLAQLDDYYHSTPVTTNVLHSADPLVIERLIRQSGASGSRVGCASTGGSFEPITAPRASTGADSTCIDPWPELVGALPGERQSAAKHQEYIVRERARVVEESKAVRATIDRQRVASIIPQRALDLYESQLQKEGRRLAHVADRLVYVTGSTRICDFQRILEPMGLMLPTMGALGFQSLAGAVATSTHGGTIHLPPTADFVRAIHLIGPGGTHWWIDRGDMIPSPRRREALNLLLARGGGHRHRGH